MPNGADLEQDMSIVPSANKPNRSQISIVHSIPELKISSNVSLIFMLNMGDGIKMYNVCGLIRKQNAKVQVRRKEEERSDAPTGFSPFDSFDMKSF